MNSFNIERQQVLENQNGKPNQLPAEKALGSAMC
jgi:hypothetical protein|tara:strand:- start:173 stop:274 length:102 start_codon:yes stop_codon:yes gene_type:complete